jgi:transcriptional regulator with XRE-family HTH domain
MSYFGEKLKERMVLKRIKQSDMGFDLRIDPSLISNIIGGRRSPVSFFSRLASYEPLEVDELTLKAWFAIEGHSEEVIRHAAKLLGE